MCLEKRSNLLKEICRRLRYKPIIKTSDGNYTRVTGVYFDDSGSPWFKLIGSDNWYTFSVIDKIVLYSKNLINKEIRISGETINPLVRFAEEHAKKNFTDEGIKASLDSKNENYVKVVNGKGESIASYDKDKPYFYNYGVDLLLKYMINLKDCSGSDFEIIEEDSEDNSFLYFR